MTCHNPYICSCFDEINPLLHCFTGKKVLKGFKSFLDVYHNSSPEHLRQLHDEMKNGHVMLIPCGQCLGCRLDKANEWAIRCVHEAKLHTHNCFITLTYNDDCLPADGSLHKEHLQLFVKRLRRHLQYNYENLKIRFLACGEYGSINMRPHYHLLVYGYFPDDVRKLSVLTNGYNLFRSPTLEKLWPYGYNTVGAVTFESARYVAKYSLKKQTGKNKYVYDELGIKPEFITCSLKPGIGADFFERYKQDIFTRGCIVINGCTYKIPKYYQILFERSEPVWYEYYKDTCRQNALARDLDPKRIEALASIQRHKQERFERDLDNLGM